MGADYTWLGWSLRLIYFILEVAAHEEVILDQDTLEQRAEILCRGSEGLHTHFLCSLVLSLSQLRKVKLSAFRQSHVGDT